MKTSLFALASTVLLSTGALAAGTPAAQSQSPGEKQSQAQAPAAKQDQAQAPAAKQDQAASQSQSSAQGAGRQAGSMSPDVVKKAQQALKDKGHDAGPIDGKYGPLTAQGVKKFQEAEKIKVTGQLDAQTLSALGVEQGSSAAGAGSEKPGNSSPASSGAPSQKKTQ